MKVLITGANGFIGQHLKIKLEREGHKVTDMSHFISPSKYKDFILWDKPDWIFHLATYGNYRSQYEEEEKTLEANVINFFHLLTAVKDIDLKAFVFTGTGWEYQNKINPCEPVNMYVSTKLCAEHLAHYFALKYDKPIVTVKPSFIYGKGQNITRFIPAVGDALANDKKLTVSPYDPLLDWIYIDDFVDALIKTARNARKYQGLAVNVSQGKSIRNSEVIKILERLFGKKLKKKIGKREDFIPDEVIKKNDIPGHRLSLEEGLKKMFIDPKIEDDYKSIQYP